MTFFSTDNRLGVNLYYAASTQNQTEGTIVRGQDGTLGGGEFIYLKGLNGTLPGMLVTYNPVGHSTALSPNTANLDQPVAVALSTNNTGSWAWYQCAGAAVILKTAVKVSPNVPVYQSATIGRVMSTAASGKELMNARTVNAATVASATSTIQVLIQRPFLQGAVL